MRSEKLKSEIRKLDVAEKLLLVEEVWNEIADRLDDLKVPPGNRLEALKGKRSGHYSIRINDQWRVCFRWMDAGAEDVEIVDYH
jgi:proteic killer suppression protein